MATEQLDQTITCKQAIRVCFRIFKHALTADELRTYCKLRADDWNEENFNSALDDLKRSNVIQSSRIYFYMV